MRNKKKLNPTLYSYFNKIIKRAPNKCLKLGKLNSQYYWQWHSRKDASFIGEYPHVFYFNPEQIEKIRIWLNKWAEYEKTKAKN